MLVKPQLPMHNKMQHYTRLMNLQGASFFLSPLIKLTFTLLLLFSLSDLLSGPSLCHFTYTCHFWQCGAGLFFGMIPSPFPFHPIPSCSIMFHHIPSHSI